MSAHCDLHGQWRAAPRWETAGDGKRLVMESKDSGGIGSGRSRKQPVGPGTRQTGVSCLQRLDRAERAAVHLELVHQLRQSAATRTATRAVSKAGGGRL